MTMPRFAHKRVGYLAANQCFTEDTEVVLLCTNHLQKEFKSQNPVSEGGRDLTRFDVVGVDRRRPGSEAEREARV